MTFIEELLQDIAQKEAAADFTEALSRKNWQNCLFLFPSKRPINYFSKTLSEQLQGNIISPSTWAIADFVTEYSDLLLLDRMSLVIELYQCYLNELEQNEAKLDLVSFYPLGETLLSDFGDIDRDLVDAKQLFSNFSALKDMEAEFGADSTENDYFKEFWKHFSSQEPKKMQSEFLVLWNMMGALYFSFKNKLLENKQAYAGLAERQMVEQFDQLLPHFRDKEIYLCGFYALTRAEIALLNKLEEIATVHYFFDYDPHYMAEHHEAGHFMRRNFSRLLGAKADKKDSYLKESKEVNITMASGTTGMVQALGQDLAELDPSHYNPKTGIILPDENALSAALQVLPDLPAELNITMGMPMQNTSIWSLISAVFSLHIYQKEEKGFRHREVLQLLQHSALSPFQNEESRYVQDEISKENLIFCSVKFFMEKNLHEVYKLIFTELDTDIFRRIRKVLFALEEQANLSHFEQTLLVQAYQQCSRFAELYSKYLQDSELTEQWMLFKKATANSSIAFEGQPLSGLQIMGLLESRSVDFEQLFILSMNEGIIPKSSKHQSLIPFGIRKAFGMNTFQEDDAMSTYYFYRMLQRAKRIHLYSNTDQDGNSKGEASRLILQLKQELDHFAFSEKTFNPAQKNPAALELQIPKNEETQKGLEQYEVKNDSSERSFSPSALSTYIKNPLQFYLRFVANFKERDEVLEEMDAITLGNVVHNTLEEVYKPYLNTPITHEITEHIKQKTLIPALDKMLSEEMRLNSKNLQGRNILLYSICQKLCLNVLHEDAATEELIIRALEFRDLHYDCEIMTEEGPKTIRLKGAFDRLDEVQGITRVVDYKTGKVQIKDENFSIGFLNPDYAAQLQTHFYTLVYLKNNPTAKVLPVVYHLKSMSEMIKPARKEPIGLFEMEEFEGLLVDKLEEIWNKGEPYQMENPEDDKKYLMMDI